MRLGQKCREIMGELRRRLGPLGWGALLVFIFHRIADCSQLLLKFLLGRYLPESDFGALEPFFAVLQVAGIPAAVIYGISAKSISRLLATGRPGQRLALIRDLMKVALIGSVLSAVVCLLARDYILVRLRLDAPVYIWILAALLVLGWWVPLLSGIVQGALRYRLISVLIISSPVITLLTTALFVGAFDGGLEGALVARVAGPILIIAAFAWGGRAMLFGQRERYGDERKLMLGTVLPMFCYTLSNVLLWRFDALFVRHYNFEQSAGFGAVITFGQIPMWLIGPLVFVVFPLASAQHVGGRDVRRTFLQAIALGGATTLACTAAFALVGEACLRYWDAEKFGGYGNYVWVYAAGMGLHALIQIVASVELARHRYRFLWVLLPGTFAMMAYLYPQGSSPARRSARQKRAPPRSSPKARERTAQRLGRR